MRVLFLNAYFSPERISFTHLEQDLIEGMLAAGHEIDVICPIPTRGVDLQTIQKYRSMKYEELHEGRVRIHRFWAPQEGKNILVRAFRYIWCNIREYMIGKRYKGVDMVFAVSTPPTQGYLAGKLAGKLGCGFVYSLQDVFPDSLVTTGITSKDSLLWKIGRKLEDKTYSVCDRVIVISNAIYDNLINKGVAHQKLSVIPNWVDSKKITPVPRSENRLISELGLDPKQFIVVYAGNVGAAQGAEVILEAAKLLQDENSIRFAIFAGGTGAEQAAKTVKEEHIQNVSMFSLLPQDRVSEVYSLGDVALITCKRGVGNSGMPSKTWSIMACNTPIIASFDVDSELAVILQKGNAGICVEPENAVLLAQAIRKKYEAAMGSHNEVSGGRAYVSEYAEKSVCVGRYLQSMYLARK